MKLSRRQFLKAAAVAGAAAAVTAIPRGIAWAKTRKLTVPLSKAEKLKEVGGSMVLKVKDYEILFARESETVVRACDAKCTHQQCAVKYNHDKKRIDCTCHGSAFEWSGKVLNGPAEKNIRVYTASLDGDRIVVEVDAAD